MGLPLRPEKVRSMVRSREFYVNHIGPNFRTASHPPSASALRRAVFSAHICGERCRHEPFPAGDCQSGTPADAAGAHSGHHVASGGASPSGSKSALTSRLLE